jgi:uncharacterized protein YicC (UPF0701 family)
MLPLIGGVESHAHARGRALAEVLHATLDRLAEAVNGVAELRPEVEARYQQRLARAAGSGGWNGSGERSRPESPAFARRSSAAGRAQRCFRRDCAHGDAYSAFSRRAGYGGETGKKLDFLLQEMNREANTLLSKTAGVAGKGTRLPSWDWP